MLPRIAWAPRRVEVVRAASRLAAPALLLVVTGCHLVFAPPDCPDDAWPALIVDIRDSITGEFQGAGARAIATDGAYADTAFVEETGFPYHLALERPGTYVLTVEKPGYQVWRREGIVVTGDACHVHTVAVDVLLQRSAPPQVTAPAVHASYHRENEE